MRTKVIDASDIDEAAERILEELKNDDAGNVIYFDGWDGLGASAVLRRVAGLLIPAAKAKEPVFHIDCSKWESRRAMQRIIAEQLMLPASVMEMFHAQDEEDDYQGVGKGSRSEIPQVTEAIYQHIQRQYHGFLVIFHNGSSQEIDLESLGFPLSVRYSRIKVLWSFQGRFRAYPRTKVDGALKSTTKTDVFLSAASSDSEEEEDELPDILHHEAKEVAREMVNTGGVIDWPAAAANCFVYMMKLCSMGSELVDYDLATHICNYWRCDGIMEALQQGDVGTDDGVDKLWLSCDALHREMRLDEDHYRDPYFSSRVGRRFLKRMAYWTSPTYGFMLIPDPLEQIPNCMFQQFNKLCVLKLSACMFSFTSPPFLCCHNLRFLWLDHCRDGSSTAEAVKEEEIGSFFQRLWVLDVRYSNKAFLSRKMMDFMTQLRELNVMGEYEELDTDMLQGRMNNIRKLRITQSNVLRGENTFSGRDKLELLEFSGNNFNHWSTVGINCGSLETVVISGPTSLNKISLTGCAKLKNIFLSGLFYYLESIEITGAAVETLDLSTVTSWRLDRLLLCACGNLCSILWSPAAEGKRKRYMDTLHIDTSTQKEGTATAAAERELIGWYISVRDARILRSLEPVKDYFGSKDAHVEISSPTHLCGDATGSNKDNRIMSSSEQFIEDNATKYADVARILKAYGGVCSHALSPAIMRTCHVPPEGCYMHIEDPVRRNKSQTASITLPVFICDAAKILHVHDSLHITSILAASSAWNQLEWCRVEGCPNLECVFNPQLIGGPEGNDTRRDMFRKLRTTWASHLPNARYIWNRSGSPWGSRHTLLRDMTLLHLDCCPRLISITNVNVYTALNNLESLEIMWCGDLSVAFQLGNWINFAFPKLKHIRLHELPKLQNIVHTNSWNYTPKLETIRIRGCWSLRKLPVVGGNKVVKCDCEKEWWNRLEWESAEHAATYKRTHPRHYKKTMIRGSVLR